MASDADSRAVSHMNHPLDTLYPEDVCRSRKEPRSLGIIQRTHLDVDSHIPQPQLDYPGLRCHKSIPKADYKRFKHDGIPPEDTVLITWQTKFVNELIPVKELLLVDRSMLVGEIVKRTPADKMSGTVVATSMRCFLSNVPPPLAQPTRGRDSSVGIPFGVDAADLKPFDNYRPCDLVVFQGWIGRIRDVHFDLHVKLCNGSVVLDPGIASDHLDHWRRDAGTSVRLRADLRRARWIEGAYDPTVPPKGQILRIDPASISIDWVWRHGDRFHDMRNHVADPPDIITITDFEQGRGRVYDGSRRPPGASVGRSHTPYMPGDLVRFKDPSSASTKYADLETILRENPSKDSNLFTLVATRTVAKVLWQDQSVESLDCNSLVPDYSIDDENAVWPGEIVVTNQSFGGGFLEDQGIFQPEAVGVVQSVAPVERIAKVKWLPKAFVQFSRYGIEDHAEELSLYECSTLGLSATKIDDCPIEDTTLYEIRTIGGLSRRRGDFVVIEAPRLPDCRFPTEAIIVHKNKTDIDWFGEVVDLNLDGMLTIRLGAANEVRDIRVTPEHTRLVYSSDGPPMPGSGDDYSTGDEGMSGTSSDLDSFDMEDEGVWEVDGVPVLDDEDWHTESDRVDEVWDSGSDKADQDVTDAVWDSGSENADQDVTMEDEEAPELIDCSELDNSTRDSAAPMTKPEESGVEVLVKPIENLASAADSSEAATDNQRPTQVNDLSGPLGIPSKARDALPQFEILDGGPGSMFAYFDDKDVTLTGARLRRIRKEYAILQSSLPEGVFVRSFETRLDLFSVLIIGPLDTPYEFAPFSFDCRLPPEFPAKPPEMHFHSWLTGGGGPINPNLYENGKVCLSLLGTWRAGEKGEAWNPAGSTILQVLVSILGLVLVKEPYYNEAGYEVRAGSEEARLPSQLYSEKTYFRSRSFILHAIENGLEGLNDVIAWLYLEQDEGAPRLLQRSIDAARELVTAGDTGTDVRAGLKCMSRGAIIMLDRQLKALERVEPHPNLLEDCRHYVHGH